MSESKFEKVSSLVDYYIDSEQQTDAALDKLSKDSHLSAAWDRYHLIGDVLRNDVPQELQLDLSAQIATAIAQEPTVLAPSSSKNTPSQFIDSLKSKVVHFAKPFGSIAIAASAAGLMVLGVQQNVAVNDKIMPAQVVQTVPFGGTANPVSLNFQQPDLATKKQAYIEQQRRFQALLSDHQQQIKLKSILVQPSTAEAGIDTPKNTEQ